MQVSFDTEEAHTYRYGRAGLDMDAHHLEQSVVAVELLEADGSVWIDLTSFVAAGEVTTEETADAYVSVLQGGFGTSNMGALVGTANYLAKRDFQFDKIHVGPTPQCATPVTAPNVCPAKTVRDGELKMVVYGYLYGSSMPSPADLGITTLRITLEYRVTGYPGAEWYYNDDFGQVTIPEGQLHAFTMLHRATDTQIRMAFEDTLNFNNRDLMGMSVTAEPGFVHSLGTSTVLVHFDLNITEVTGEDEFIVYDPMVYTSHAGHYAGILDAGRTAVYLDTTSPFVALLGRADTDVRDQHVQQRYLGAALLDEDGNAVLQYSEPQAADDSWVFNEGSYFSADLRGHLGTESEGLALGVHTFLARETTTFSHVTVGDATLCATPVTAPGECSELSLREGDLAFAVYATTTGSEFVDPASIGGKWLRVSVEYSFAGLGAVDVYYNDDKQQRVPPSDPLSSITFRSGSFDTEVHCAFGSTFNLNDTVAMEVRVSAADGPSQSVYVHYDFDVSAVSKEGQTIVYNPSLVVHEIDTVNDDAFNDDIAALGFDDFDGEPAAACGRFTQQLLWCAVAGIVMLAQLTLQL